MIEHNECKECDAAENRCTEIGHVWMQGCQTCLENKVRAALRERLADEFIQMLFSAPMSRLRDDDGAQYVHRDEAINLARRVGRGA